MEIRGKTISYSSFKKKNENIKETQLIHEIDDLQNDLHDENIETLELKKNQS